MVTAAWGNRNRRRTGVGEAVEDRARALLAGAPDSVFRAAGVLQFGDLDVLQWHSGREVHAPVVSATDLAVIRNGRISALFTHWEP